MPTDLLPTPVDLRSVVRVSEMAGDGAEETELLQEMLDSARRYLTSHSWCPKIRGEYFGGGVGRVAAVFLFSVEPLDSGDRWLWVVVGDLPPAYLVADEAPTPEQALFRYCEMMEDWIHAVRGGGDLSEQYPISAPADEEHAAMLESRLRFLRTEFLPWVRGR